MHALARICRTTERPRPLLHITHRAIVPAHASVLHLMLAPTRAVASGRIATTAMARTVAAATVSGAIAAATMSRAVAAAATTLTAASTTEIHPGDALAALVIRA